jgi:hypothetical protein
MFDRLINWSSVIVTIIFQLLFFSVTQSISITNYKISYTTTAAVYYRSAELMTTSTSSTVGIRRNKESQSS